MSRARSVEIYLKPGIEEDDQVHRIWMALRGRARPQDVFRRALRLGIRAMAEAGELPGAAVEALEPGVSVSRGSGRALFARGAPSRPRVGPPRIAPRPEPSAVPRADAAPAAAPSPVAAAPAPTAPTVADAGQGKRKLGRIM